MRYLLLIVMLLSTTASAQSIVVSGGRQSIIVSGQTAAVITGREATKAVPPAMEIPPWEPDPTVDLLMEIESLRQEVAELKKQRTVAPKPAAPAVTVKAPVVAKANTQPLRMQWNIQGDWSPTESQTRRHLESDHGVSTAGMSHQQMLNLHDSLHNGTKTVSKPAVRYVQPVRYQSNCPGGVCPTPVYRTVRRR